MRLRQGNRPPHYDFKTVEMFGERVLQQHPAPEIDGPGVKERHQRSNENSLLPRLSETAVGINFPPM